jgi:hypothetical protein
MSSFHIADRLLANIAVLVLVFSAFSCATHYHGLEPISPPPPTDFGGAEKVDSLQPTLSWKTIDTKGTKYDLVVYDGIVETTPCGSWGLARCISYQRGKEVLYVEGLEGGSYRFREPLEPLSVYLWAVRTRNGSEVGPWSTYDWQRGLIPGLPNSWGSKWWWSFATPRRR